MPKICECGKSIEIEEATGLYIHIDDGDMFCDDTFELMASPVDDGMCRDGENDRDRLFIACQLEKEHKGSHKGNLHGLDLEWDDR
jgi:hypothetical protein